MKRLFVFPGLILAACAPQVTTAPVIPPVTYAAPQAEVFGAVAAAIVSDPGVPAYKNPFNPAGENMQRQPTGGWNIVQSDQAGGSLRAEAQSTLVTTFGTNSGQRETHTVNVTVTGGGNTATVIIGTSPRAAYMREKITAALDSKFKRQ